jgi:hypothetical protein
MAHRVGQSGKAPKLFLGPLGRLSLLPSPLCDRAPIGAVVALEFHQGAVALASLEVEDPVD